MDYIKNKDNVLFQFLTKYFFKKHKYNYRINKLKIWLLSYLNKYSKKKIEINLIRLKYIYLNSNMVAEYITRKLITKRKSLLKVKRKIFTKAKLVLYNRYIWDKLNIFNIMDINSLRELSSLKLNNYYIYLELLRRIKYKFISGIRLIAAGRLTRRNIAARSLKWFCYKGSLKNIDSSFKFLSVAALRGDWRPNLDYTLRTDTAKTGSFGVKTWISYYSYSTSSSSSINPIKIYINADTQNSLILKDNENKSGIYRWVNLINGKSYIGSSINLYRRLKEYSIIYLCNPEYNILKIVGSFLGFKHSKITIAKMKKRKDLEETRAKIIVYNKKRIITETSLFGNNTWLSFYSYSTLSKNFNINKKIINMNKDRLLKNKYYNKDIDISNKKTFSTYSYKGKFNLNYTEFFFLNNKSLEERISIIKLNKNKYNTVNIILGNNQFNNFIMIGNPFLIENVKEEMIYYINNYQQNKIEYISNKTKKILIKNIKYIKELLKKLIIKIIKKIIKRFIIDLIKPYLKLILEFIKYLNLDFWPNFNLQLLSHISSTFLEWLALIKIPFIGGIIYRIIYFCIKKVKSMDYKYYTLSMMAGGISETDSLNNTPKENITLTGARLTRHYAHLPDLNMKSLVFQEKKILGEDELKLKNFLDYKSKNKHIKKLNKDVISNILSDPKCLDSDTKLVSRIKDLKLDLLKLLSLKIDYFNMEGRDARAKGATISGIAHTINTYDEKFIKYCKKPITYISSDIENKSTFNVFNEGDSSKNTTDMESGITNNINSSNINSEIEKIKRVSSFTPDEDEFQYETNSESNSENNNTSDEDEFSNKRRKLNTSKGKEPQSITLNEEQTNTEKDLNLNQLADRIIRSKSPSLVLQNVVYQQYVNPKDVWKEVSR
uniref:ribosomal protein S3 n=1 Tax=Drechslerella dactyloides TaxID=74499 RepID=UPI0022FD6877|nr:ribosomal protein S3 [Drechslerella dactyloides]WAN89798.1 ribosomal protein S3 [Drechslerella dactyloides]